MKKDQIYYYSDELNDEFSGSDITPRIIDQNYKYLHKNIFWNIAHFLVQNVLSVPIKVLYAKLKFRVKYIGKEKLKKYKKEGYFVYANHTQVFADTFLTSNAIYPKRNYLIVNPENVSMKFLGNFVQMFGAIPIPNNKDGMKNFLSAIKYHIQKEHSITIYPEAHIWPYYTKIRPFKTVSFRYPIELEKPVFCITNTYQKRGKNKVKITSYIDGPFFVNKEIKGIKEQKRDLRDRVYNTMVERSKQSNYEVIKYVKKKG